MDPGPLRHLGATLLIGIRPVGRFPATVSQRDVLSCRCAPLRNQTEEIPRPPSDCGCAVTAVPATSSAENILALKPDGVFLSNGPGDPAETGRYAVPTIKALLQAETPIFGICLGHQMLGLAVGARTVKMSQGHHGLNHPVPAILTTGKSRSSR